MVQKLKRIKILHLSDIQISEKDDSYIDKINLFIEASSKFNLYKKIDYIVICGSLTKNGEWDNYLNLLPFLENLSQTFLKNKDDLGRFLIVPGKNDISYPYTIEENYNLFKDFYSLFYKNKIDNSEISEFNFDRPIFRELKDITLIGITCFPTNNDSSDQLLTSRAKNGLYNIDTMHISKLNYLNSTPTILVSSEAPLFVWKLQDLYDQNFKRVLTNRLNISMNLFGTGLASCIMPEPFAHSFISIGNGIKKSGIEWPFNMNVINLEIKSYEKQSNICHNFIANANAYQKREINEVWQEEKFLADYNLISTECEISSDKSICIDLIETLTNEINKYREGVVLVKGFPGSGKKLLIKKLDFYAREIMESSEQRNNQNYYIVSGEITNYLNLDLEVSNDPNLPVRDQKYYESSIYKKEISLIKEKINDLKDLYGKNAKIAAFIYDSAFNDTEDNQKNDKLLMVFNDLQLILKSQNIIIFYFIRACDITFSIENKCISTLNLPLCRNISQKIVSQYQPKIPVQGTYVDIVSGNYFGFRDLLLKEAEDTFDSWDGSELIKNNTGKVLVSQTIERSNIIHKKIKVFLDCLEQSYGGAELSDYIQKMIYSTNTNENNSINLDDLNELRISENDLIQNYGVDKGVAAYEVIKDLVKYEIFDYTDNKNEVKIHLKIPFLMKITNKHKIFISYFSELTNEALEIHGKLYEHAAYLGKKIEVYLDHVNGPNDNGYSESINTALDQSSNLILLFNKKHLNHNVAGEFRRWLSCWQDKPNKFIPINYMSQNDPDECPYEFQDYHILNAVEGIDFNDVIELLV